MSWLVYIGSEKLDCFQLFEYWYQESLKIIKGFQRKFLNQDQGH